MMTNSEKSVWEEYKKKVSHISKITNDLEKQFSEYSDLVHEIKQVVGKLKSDFQDISMGVALRHWLLNMSENSSASVILNLIENNLFPIQNKQGNLITLGHLLKNSKKMHQEALEAIRSAQNLSSSEKEKSVNCYIDFSRYLHTISLGMIPEAFDPIRHYTSHKVIDYDHFVKFVQALPERDALIAKLLYFGAPTVDDVLFLTYGQLDFNKYSIQFLKRTVSYPKYFLLELFNFLGKKKKTDLIFINFRGNQIARTHLNHSFGRASKGLIHKITPRDLLRTKTEISQF
jgi:hypothetical protein